MQYHLSILNEKCTKNGKHLDIEKFALNGADWKKKPTGDRKDKN